MIAEDYVSFEIAKLLKEKGFDWECETSYYISNKGCENAVFVGDFTKVRPWREALIAAPTLQMAMKWLREVHRLFIGVDLGVCNVYTWEIITMDNDTIVQYDATDSYEQACEAALKYCLENLI